MIQTEMHAYFYDETPTSSHHEYSGHNERAYSMLKQCRRGICTKAHKSIPFLKALESPGL